MYAIFNFDNCGHAYAAVRARVTRSQLRRQLLDSSQTAPRQLPDSSLDSSGNSLKDKRGTVVRSDHGEFKGLRPCADPRENELILDPNTSLLHRWGAPPVVKQFGTPFPGPPNFKKKSGDFSCPGLLRKLCLKRTLFGQILDNPFLGQFFR